MDIKPGGIAAAAAFILSFIIGLVSRAKAPLLIIWPLIFALVFFVLINLAKFLLSRFLPELLGEESSGANPFPGSVVDIMEGGTPGLAGGDTSDTSAFGDAFALQASNAAANAARPDDAGEVVEDISALSEVITRNKDDHEDVSLGIDHNIESGYNGVGDTDNTFQPTSELNFEAVASAVNDSPVRSAAKSGGSALLSDSESSIPELDSITGAYSSTSSEEDEDDPSRRSKSANKSQTLEGNFSPKEIARGIQSVLKKDKED